MRVAHPNAPPENVVLVSGLEQEAEGRMYHARGHAALETTDVLLKADEIHWNRDTDVAEAIGAVYFMHYEGGEEIWADRVEFNLKEQTGRYYNIRGSSPAKIEARPGVLTTSNPFVFQGKWAERIKNRYILHNGFITVCKLPNPMWVLRAPKFDVIPGDRALAYRAIFRLKKVPLFYSPVFYKSLERMPRKSGFLTPNIGNSSRRGKMIGVGYYWAINRSYDAQYRAQLFTQRGIAHHVDLRGKPNARSDFNFILYGVNDRGLELGGGERRKEGGFLMSLEGRSDLGHGVYARGQLNYLSSFQFRQAFTESFYEAISSEVHSIGFAGKEWASNSLYLVAVRNETFRSTEPDDKVVIRKLPSLEFFGRDREVSDRVLPLWVSLEGGAGLVRRDQPLFQTRQFMERMDFAPRITTAFHWKDFHLVPSFGVRETHYGEQQTEERVFGQNINRHARDVTVDLIAPSLERVFDSPKWLGDKVKHVIEPRFAFRYVSGVSDFNRLIRFDETELLSNTTEAEASLTNRLFSKHKDGNVEEVLSWQLWAKWYFDPDFGGAVLPGRRNVVSSSADMTGYSFLAGPRRYSPVISALKLRPGPFGVEWRTDYDPLYHKFINNTLSADARFSKYFLMVGHNRVSCIALRRLDPSEQCADTDVPRLSPPSNQITWMAGFGNEQRRGWMAAFSAVYDFRKSVMQYATTQVTYNTDCCGLSFQYRRFSFGTRNENQFRIAFAIANIGSFGTLKKQERLF